MVMSYKIVCDSCTDLPDSLKSDKNIIHIPLTLQVGKDFIKDDDSFDQKDFIKKMAESSEAPRSACPSPDAFLSEYGSADEVFVITLSGKLSGSFNSAVLAKKLYLEDHPYAKICVIDSKSASIGQTLILKKIIEYEAGGLQYPEILPLIKDFRDNMSTRFVLETLEVFRKNGRLNGITASVINVLNIKAIMAGDDGNIKKLDQARGMDRALLKLSELISGDVKNPENRILGIAHCNNPKRAQIVKDLILERVKFMDTCIVETRGVSTMYANDGGIIVAY
jgi:DegV family protein with EDD domain